MVKGFDVSAFKDTDTDMGQESGNEGTYKTPYGIMHFYSGTDNLYQQENDFK